MFFERVSLYRRVLKYLPIGFIIVNIIIYLYTIHKHGDDIAISCNRLRICDFQFSKKFVRYFIVTFFFPHYNVRLWNLHV